MPVAPLVFEKAVPVDVLVLAVDEVGLAMDPLPGESHRFEQALRSLVELEHAGFDPVEAELLEAVLDESGGGVAAVSLPVVIRGDPVADLGAVRPSVDLTEADGSDWRLAVGDQEVDVVVLADDVLEEVSFLVGVQWSVATEAAPDALVVDPGLEELQILFFDRSQEDVLAFEEHGTGHRTLFSMVVKKSDYFAPTRGPSWSHREPKSAIPADLLGELHTTCPSVSSVFGYSRRSVVLDLLVAAVAVPLVLIGIHLFVTPEGQSALVLQHGDPDPVEFLTAAYVHSNWPHLRNNVTGYVAAIVMAYLLCLQAGRRRWFHVTVAALLVVVPIAVNLVSYAAFAPLFPEPPSTRGFSAVVAAAGGFVYVAVLVLLRTVYSKHTATFAGAGIFLALMTAFYVVNASVVDPLLLAGVAGSGALCVLALATTARGRLPTDRDGWRTLAAEAVPIVLVTALLVAFVVGLFPSRVIVDGMVINVYAHGLGLVFGVVVSAVLERVVSD